MRNLPKEYEYDINGFLKQKLFIDFKYTIDYKNKQSTNANMSYLRLGWLSSFFSYEKMMSMDVIDIGCGNGCFIDCCKGKFKSINFYDVVGDSISKTDLYSKVWDLAVLSDVLEHYHDIEDLFLIKWKYCLLSFPEMPEFDDFEDFSKWRHFKPNEHIYYLKLNNIIKWIKLHDGCEIVSTSNFEDLIRKRWNEEKTNISSVLIYNKKNK